MTDRSTCISCIVAMILLAAGVSSCRRDPLANLYGTWKGKTKIDQDITITIKPDSTIQIETEADSVRQVKSGKYQVVDRRLRILLTRTEVFEGDSVRTRSKLEQDEAVYTVTTADELVLRRGENVIVLNKVSEFP